MGVCLFLALNEEVTNPNLNVIVLDDVMMSVDAGHRRELCSLINDQFGHCQFVITTHDKTWASQLKQERVVQPSQMVEFTSWTVDDGPSHRFQIDLQEYEKAAILGHDLCVGEYPDMAAIKYKVKLAESERSRLNEVSHRGKPSVRTVKRALALLKADEGLRDGEIAGALLINAATVARVRKRFVEEGLEAAINDKPRPGRERKLGGRQEAHLLAIACSNAPEGHTSWTLHQLRGQGGGAGVCREHLPGDGAPDTQKNELKPWKKKEWCIPKVSGEFVARMEDVLDLYHEEYDRERPVVCFDETSKQLLGDVRPPVKAKPGRVERYDTEYQRNGTRNLFMSTPPVNRRVGGGTSR